MAARLIAVMLSVALMFEAAAACDLHEHETTATQPQSQPHKVAAATFSPERPAHPSEGEVWVNARTGAQEMFRDGQWRMRAPALIR